MAAKPAVSPKYFGVSLQNGPPGQPIEAGQAEQLLHGLFHLPRPRLYIAVYGPQSLFLRHDGLQDLIGRDAGQDLALEMELHRLRRIGMLCAERSYPRRQLFVQLRAPFRELLRGRLTKGRKDVILFSYPPHLTVRKCT